MGARSVEAELPSAVLIAWDAQVVRLTNVGTELDGVIPLDLRPIVDELELIFILVQRAVAAVDAQREAELEQIAAVVIDEERRHASGELLIQIQARNSGIGGWLRIKAVWNDVHLVAEIAEAEVRKQRWLVGVVETRRDAVVARLRRSGKGAGAAAGVVTGSTCQPVDARREDLEVHEAIASEYVQLIGRVVVAASIECVVIEVHRARARVVRLIARSRNVRLREQLQQGRRLLGDAVGGNYRTRKLSARGGCRTAGRIINFQTQSTQVADALGGRRNAEQYATAGVAAGALVVAKVEDLVLLDGAAD